MKDPSALVGPSMLLRYPRVAALLGLSMLCVPLSSCAKLQKQKSESSTIELTIGNETRRFDVRTAFAQYWELSGEADELRVTLASYEASCTHFVPPPADGVVVTVQVLVPDGTRLAPGDYPWAGPEAHGGAPRRPEKAYSLPYARKGARGFTLAPGGGLSLSELDLRAHGHASGLLSFQGSSDDPAAATRLTGTFRARLCSYSPLPAPPGAIE